MAAEPTLFDEASLALIASGGAGKDGKVYSIKPVPEHGPELVTNGDFATDSDWSKGGGATISGGQANIVGDGSSYVSITQNSVFTTGKKYKVSADVTINSGLGLKFQDGATNENIGFATSSGTYVFDFTAGSNTSLVVGRRTGGTAFNSSVDNISVKEISNDGDFDFSRGSNLAATRVNASGLIEKGRENLWLQSTDLDTSPNATTSAASITGGQSGYDGSSNAWELESLSDGFYRRLYQSATQTGVITFSIYAKSANTDSLLIYNNQNGDRAWFDLSNGSLGNLNGAIDSSIEDIGNGWYRCSISLITSASSEFWICPANGNNVASCDLGNSIYLQSAQLEIGLAATDYIESGASTGKAGLLEDEPRFDYSGGATCPSLLLEPSRTQLIGQSEYFDSWTKVGSPTITNNYGISPEGLTNSTRLETTSDRIAYDLVTINANETFSIYMKGSGTLRMQVGDDNFYPSVTSDWVRYEFKTTQAGNRNLQIRGNGSAVDVELYGAQYERASYPTSYIPNHSGGSVTRGFDYSIVESLGYSSTFTFYYEFNTTTGREGSSPFAEAGKDQSNKIWVKGASADSPQFSVQGNGIFSGSISVTNEVSGINKIAVQWSSGVGVVFCNGVKQSGTLTNSDTSQTIDFISTKGEGTSHDSKQMLFFEETLSDTECIKLTTI